MSANPYDPEYPTTSDPSQADAGTEPLPQPGDSQGHERIPVTPPTYGTAPIGQPPLFQAAPVYETRPMGDGQPTAQMPGTSAGHDPYQGQHAAPQGAPVPPPPYNHGNPSPAPAPASKKGNGGKTFLFGFLGALVACALCLGGFALWNSTQGSSGSGASGTVTNLGASQSTSIEAAEEGATLAEVVAAKALPSVVAVYNYQDAGTVGSYGYGSSSSTSSDGLVASGMGSGVVISDEGYILTNYHVVDGAKVVRVTVNGAERDAKYVGGDSSSDVAVVKVEDTEGLTPVDIGNSDDLVIGEWVMTIGAPLGLEQSVATGVVSATNRSTIMDSNADSNSIYGSQSPDYTYYPNMIQTDAVINPGNSGGALVDADGKLIGINTMISSYSGDYAGVGFAIPVNYAMGIASDIIAGKTPTHAMLGVSISSVNARMAQRYGFDVTSGAYINAITPGTGAADSDLREGDIITAIDGVAVASATDVTLDVRGHAVGDTVKVTVNRDGSTQDVDVVLSSDENLLSNGSPQSQDNGQDNQQSPNGNSQNLRNLEDILRMFGM